ncbi:hypothetical protein IAG25_33190 [Caballeronia sp. EK]|uniref:hypothetical protein n=1 Tax=Caballeronia sp. EK TaxID=2767469 RepID=UPI0016563473|nr:hypothetical protein [Caballeronia sp. EK]MBC8641683.1 hypothetical protein [Caballeronia sp. EK]
MSKLAAINESVPGSKRELPATENFVLQVTGYTQDEKGRDAITGLRMDTGEDVTVVLRPYKGDKPLKSPRAEVKDFIAQDGEISNLMRNLPSDEMRKQVLKGMKAKTEPGGSILVQRAYVEPSTGIVNAGWLQSAAKYPEHSAVLGNVMLRVDPVAYAERNGVQVSSSAATAIAPERSQLVTSAEELNAALEAAFTGLPGVNARPLALIRLNDGGESKAIEFPLPVKRNEDGEFIKATPRQAMKVFLGTDSGKATAQLAGDPDLTIEVIPGARISLGSQAKASFEQGANGLEQVNRLYRFTKADQSETGFTPSYVVLHDVGDAQVFSTAEPLSNKPALFHSRDISTKHLDGKPAAVAEIRDVPVAAHAETQTGSMATDDDEEFSIDDAIGNHIPAEAMAPSAPRMRA